ncbi:zinc metallochaperone AztD [Rhodococcus tibetensis]|uniref:Zinc metallochaperone AztD n=1 Tax=Rhodococcus tibetensis TaxID=2965064 RepID=A0ABT1QFW2_9NOCA|nr:zinc metallochaperone AztD [Rhodococcus sp. FXJ9.536]MCQ4121143.1 zinc metallochaperone AztD [Rhodococcus sp. FXJ9.536]
MTLLRRSPLPAAVVALGLSAAFLSSCSSDSAGAATDNAAATRTDSATPRLALSYDGGVLVLDAKTLDVVGTAEMDGFNRLNPAGDGRHVLVSTGNSFTALDAGTWTDGDSHFVSDPAVTDISFEAKTPGHVVRHDGKTVLFDDGTGLVRVFDPAQLADGLPETTDYTTPEAHHGVAVELSDGSMLTTVGNEDERTGIVVLDRDRKEIARNEECPGVHGEAVAADETVVVGCQNGLLIYREGVITKVTSPDPYGRIGNQAGDEDSPIILGDYKTDPDAELERPQRVSLTDTTTGQLTLVDLGTSYTFRSLGRGVHGEALVLGTDGALHVIDPASKTVTRTVPLIEPWTEPEKWQAPRPALFVQDGTAYVTDPAKNKIHAVNLESWTVSGSADLPQTPNEITGVTG